VVLFLSKGVRNSLKVLRRSMRLRTFNEVIARLIIEHDDNAHSTHISLQTKSEVTMLQSKVTKLEIQVTHLQKRLDVGGPTVKRPVKDAVEKPTTTPPETPTSVLHPSHLPTLYPSSQCQFFSEPKDGIVGCSKDWDRKGIIQRVTEDVCGLCWDRVQKRLHEGMEASRPKILKP